MRIAKNLKSRGGKMSSSSASRSTPRSTETPTSTSTPSSGPPSSRRKSVHLAAKVESKVIKTITTSSADEETLKEICSCNGLNYNKLASGDSQNVSKLEMFFSGYPKMIALSLFPNLTTLVIMGQTINKIEDLSAISKLQELWICECNLTIIENVEACKNLRKLYLYGNHIQTIENIGRLKCIEVLWLNNNDITNIENIGTLYRLKELNLARNHIEKIGRSLDGNTKLEDLNLSGNKISFLKDLTNLTRIPHLVNLSLKDPLYPPCPVSLLCNYSTHILHFLPMLQRLDTYDVRSKHLSDLAESTVNKKKMYYNMRVKTCQRNLSALLTKIENHKHHLLLVPEQRLRTITSLIKEIEKDGIETISVDCVDSDTESEKDSKEQEIVITDSECPIMIKLTSLREREVKLAQACEEIKNFSREITHRLTKNADTTIDRFMVELETGGNVRFEEGLSTDVWFNYCRDLIMSRFCAVDYKDHGVIGIKLHNIRRIHNRVLRDRFEKNLFALSGDKDEFQFLSKNTANNKLLEYLFWMWDPEIPGGGTEMSRIIEEGFPDADMYKKLGKDGAVPLSNSLSLADRRRIDWLLKNLQEREPVDSCPFRYGHLVVCKAYLGKSLAAIGERPINKFAYNKIDSVFKPRIKVIPNEKRDTDGKPCDCSSRQCEWYIFDHEMVLPEYIIDFEYITKARNKSPFADMSFNIMENQDPFKELKVVHYVGIDNVGVDGDKDLLQMEPIIKARPRHISISDAMLMKMCRVTSLENVSVLNLHGNALTKVRQLQSLKSLRKLILTFNDLTKLDDLTHMSLEYLDVSFNKITTLDGLRGLSCLKYFDVSWNRLSSTREELATFRKHISAVKTLNVRFNPWQKPEGLRLRLIGRLKLLTMLDGEPVTDDETGAALRLAAGSRISQFSIFTHSRVDNTAPQSLCLHSMSHIILQISRQKPEKVSEHDTSWYLRITTLNLDKQHISKLSNMEKLENLKWASFNNNDLTKIEGLDHCLNLEELSLEGNCIVKVEGLAKLTKLKRLSIGNNYISTLDNAALTTLTSLTYMSIENNKITSLVGLHRSTTLVELYVGNNQISNIREVFCLKMLPNLVILDIYGNPSMEIENYRLFIIYHLKTLKALDGSPIAASEGNMAKETFGGRLTPDFVAERLGHSNFLEVRELDLPRASLRIVDLGIGDQFLNLRSVNLEHNNLTSFTGLVHLVNLRVLCLNHNHIECVLPKVKPTNPKQKFPSGGYPSKTIDFYADILSPVLENLEVLHLGYNNIKDMATLQLGRLPALRALFLQGNEITKVEGLDELHDLRELVLDRNKIKSVSEQAFINQWNLIELHLEENRVRELSNLTCLENLQRLFLGSNRIQDIGELEKLESLSMLIEISVVNNLVARRLVHRPMLVYRMPQIVVIDGLPVTDEERMKADVFYTDQQAYYQPMNNQSAIVEATLPGIGQYKAAIPVKVTNVQLSSPPTWNGSAYYEEAQETIQRGGGRRRGPQRTDNSWSKTNGGTGSNVTYQHHSNNNRNQYSYINTQPQYSSQSTADYVESLTRMNNPRNSKR